MPVAMRPPLVLDYTMAGLATQTVPYTALRPFVVFDVHAGVIAQDVGGAVGPVRTTAAGVGPTAVCTALVTTGAPGTVVRVTAGFSAAQFVFAVGDILGVVFTSPNTNLNARAWVTITPTAIAGVAAGREQGLSGN